MELLNKLHEDYDRITRSVKNGSGSWKTDKCDLESPQEMIWRVELICAFLTKSVNTGHVMKKLVLTPFLTKT